MAPALDLTVARPPSPPPAVIVAVEDGLRWPDPARPAPPSAMISHADADPDLDRAVRPPVGGRSTRARRAGVAIGVTITIVAWFAGGFDASSLGACLVFVPAGVAAMIDVATGMLPDRWVLATAAGGLTWTVLESGATGPLGWSIAALLVAVPVTVVHAIVPAEMGFGDVKFAAALGGAAGVSVTSPPDRVLLAMVLLAVASGAALAYGVVGRRHSVPFGPCLLLGGSVAMVAAIQGAMTT
jgi:prepilin signal peptidase PulO-like enzyme (type II secretory pathway)